MKEEKESPINSAVTAILSSAPTNNSDLLASLRSALDQATKRPKQFKHWTKSTHGLKLSILEDANTGKPFKVLTLAVKNTTSASLNLVATSPELLVETVDEQGTTVNLHSIAKAQTETNASGVIAAGATAYFAIAYASPVLDAHQHLKIVVAQTDAADEPASIKLAASGR